MPDDNRYQPPEENQDNENIPDEPAVSASVTFMEMMRQAASNARPQPPEPVETVADEPKPAPKPQDPLLPEDPEERRRRHAAALETQRIKRVKRRRTRRRRHTVSLLGGFLRSVIMVLVAGGLIATIFVWWTPNQFISTEVRNELSLAQAAGAPTPVPTIQPTPNWLRKIGIVSGHRGPELDPGAVCPDGLTEAEINFDVAQRVVRLLREQGFSVDLLDEFDPRLDDYQAAALVSIHANTCQDFGEIVSGYLVAAAASRVTARGDDQVLVGCIARYYEQATNLERHSGLTEDMTNYHTFREIHALTPAAIIELGFMLSDRDLLTNRADVVAEGVANGVLCFLDPRQAPPAEAAENEA